MEFKNFDEFNGYIDAAIEGMDYTMQRLDDAHDIFWHAVNWNLPIFVWTDCRSHLNGYYVPDDFILNDEIWEDDTLIVDSVRITPNLNLDEARRFGPYSMTICFHEAYI